MRRICRVSLIALLFLLSLIRGVSGGLEILDSIAAVVNGEVITLSDLRIAEALGIYKMDTPEAGGDLSQILEKMIDQMLVIGLTRDAPPVEEAELESAVDRIKTGMESGGYEAALARFGLGEQDVLEYIREKILYERIIEDRFGLTVVVRLSEIKNHYENVYVPLQESKGRRPLPLIDVIAPIESALRQEGIGIRVGEWLSAIKSEADIQIQYQRRKR